MANADKKIQVMIYRYYRLIDAVAPVTSSSFRGASQNLIKIQLNQICIFLHFPES
jgi:hypothetical protein